MVESDIGSEKVSHKPVGSKDIIDLYEICFSEYGWSYEELMDMPIPVFIETIEALKRRKVSEAKAYKKPKNKRMNE
jgi:hypothetical protein